MKERIRIEVDTKKCKSCSNECKRKLEDRITCELRNNLTPKLSYEKCPTSWEELKEMCKDITLDLKVTKDGKIYCYEYLLAENRTLAQMWAIIKNLIGEE